MTARDVATSTLRHLPVEGGAQLSWLERGPRDGPTAVVIPGLSDGVAPIWSDFGRAVAQLPAPAPLRHLRGLMVSHRDPIGNASVAGLAADLARLVEREATAPVLASGHSLGGLVALRLAADRPDLVGAVVATGCGLRATPPLRDHLATRPRSRGAPFAPELLERHDALAAACRDHDAGEDAARVTTPVLLVAGGDDPIVPAEQVDALADALQDATTVLLPGLGHDFPERAPRRVAEAVGNFLRGTNVDDAAASSRTSRG